MPDETHMAQGCTQHRKGEPFIQKNYAPDRRGAIQLSHGVNQPANIPPDFERSKVSSLNETVWTAQASSGMCITTGFEGHCCLLLCEPVLVAKRA